MAKLPSSASHDDPIQLPPDVVRITPEAVFSVDTTTAVSKTVVSKEHIELQKNEDFALLIKYNGTCTTSNFDDRIPNKEYSKRYIVPSVDGSGTLVTSISLLSVGGTNTVCLIRKK